MFKKYLLYVDGFELRNLKTSDSNLFPAGIWIHGTSHHVEILNNQVHHIEQNVLNGEGGAHGIAVYGTSASASVNNIIIENNEISDCLLGWSESLVLNGNVENFVIRNNSVHDNNNIAYDFIGHEGECPNPSLDQVRNGLVIGNIAYNIDSRLNPAYGSDDPCADGFYVDGGKDIILERNTVYQCNIGFELASEHGGKSTSGIIIRNNLIYNNHVIGIAIGGYDQNRGETKNCYIVNNTLFENNSDNLDWGAEILIQYYCMDNVIKNNIIYSKANISMLSHESSTGQNNILDYNIYYTTGTPLWNWNNNSYSEFNSYKVASAQEDNTRFVNPDLEKPDDANIYLKSGSPAIDRGG